jgi:hypothetical protein
MMAMLLSARCLRDARPAAQRARCVSSAAAYAEAAAAAAYMEQRSAVRAMPIRKRYTRALAPLKAQDDLPLISDYFRQIFA